MKGGGKGNRGGRNHIQNKYIYLADENQKVLKLGECQNG